MPPTENSIHTQSITEVWLVLFEITLKCLSWIIYQIEATVLPLVMFVCDVIGFIQINEFKDIQLLSSLQKIWKGYWEMQYFLLWTCHIDVA